MRLDLRTVLVLFHPDREQVLLINRAADKKLFPNLITGIGGKVELERGEGECLEQAALRELEEETAITREMLQDLRLRLSTHLVRGEELVMLLWFTAQLIRVPADLTSPDGQLAFYSRGNLPTDQMVPTAREAIAFVVGRGEEDRVCDTGTYGPDQVSLHVR